MEHGERRVERGLILPKSLDESRELCDHAFSAYGKASTPAFIILILRRPGVKGVAHVANCELVIRAQRAD